MYLFTFITTVPPPSVTVTAPNTQIVGQPLTLECNAVTVRGITSRAEFIWRRGRVVVQRLDNAPPTTMNSTLMYYSNYTISPLSTNDDGIGFECRLVIRASSAVRNMDTVTLDVTGKQ